MHGVGFIAHELQPGDGNGDGLGTYAEKTSNINNHLSLKPCSMQVGYVADLFVTGPVDGRSIEIFSVSSWARRRMCCESGAEAGQTSFPHRETTHDGRGSRLSAAERNSGLFENQILARSSRGR